MNNERVCASRWWSAGFSRGWGGCLPNAAEAWTPTNVIEALKPGSSIEVLSVYSAPRGRTSNSELRPPDSELLHPEPHDLEDPSKVFRHRRFDGRPIPRGGVLELEAVGVEGEALQAEGGAQALV